MSSITPKPGMTVEISMQGIEKSRLDAIEAAESLRKVNEAERANAELMRKEDEAGRITAEQERTMEEDARNLAESGRILAEEIRVTAENLRSNGEQSRVESEEMRENAEAARVTAETERANVEALRQQTFETNEANRNTAFESAESARESEWTEIKSNVETSVGSAVASASAATDAANAAADNANAAAEKSVRYDEAQTLRDTQKAQARENIEAASEAYVSELKDDISNLRFGDPYDGIDLVAKFADEISGYTDPGAWIRARIRANNFDGIHVNDYIPFTTTNGLKFKARVAGIDPYYEYGDSAVGHHIDFVCEELWPTLKPINPVNYNNGLIPTENVTSDGTATQYVLTKPMYGVAKVALGGADLTGWTYDKDTYTMTFSAAPAAGTMVVTGTGYKHPWLASDAYLYVNSMAGHVANSTGVNPAIKRVDYTNDGIYHYLPAWLKAVIIEKLFLLNERYSTSGVLSDENSWNWVNIGKLWFPTEIEVYGCPVWGNKVGFNLGGAIQYPLFMGNMRRLKNQNGSRYAWWLLSQVASTTHWCYVSYAGNAGYSIASDTGIAAPVCFRIS